MGVFSEMHAAGLTIRDMLIERGIIKCFVNNSVSAPFDHEDTENVKMIKEVFKDYAIFTITKMDMLRQRDLMYNNSKRFICILNRNHATGSGYQDIIGYDQFDRVYQKYIQKSEKMICFSTLYSKFRQSNGKIRTIENINRTSVFVQDCDAGKKGMPIREQLERIAKLVKEGKILMPNIVLFSGSGIQLIWLIDNLIMKLNTKVFESWVGIQKAMFKALQEAGLDPDYRVLDPSHNTRLVDTFNLRAGNKLVRGYVLHTERKKLGDFINFYFTELHDVFKKSPKPKVKKAKKTASTTGKVIKSPKFWSLRSYAWGMIQDMKLIPVLKEKYGETLVGLKWRWRMATIVRFFALIYYDCPVMAIKEVEDWWNGLPHSQRVGTSLKEIIRRSRTAERYYREFKENNFDKKKYKRAGLFYKNQTLIEELQLSVDIQLHLNIIKSRSYKDKDGKKKWNTEYERKRKTLENRAKGIRSHAEKKKEKIEAIKAVLESDPNASTRDIEKETGIPYRTVARLIKEFGLK